MGCPDWPTCFGSLVPPTSVDQLPDNYKEEYAGYRDKKNQRFASFLSAIGMKETADKILQDPSVLVEEDFNAAKTWVEYVNRLVGVAIGLFIVALFVTALPLRADRPGLFYMSLGLLILVLIQGWFGSIVVSTNLTPWTVTVHMFLAIVMVIMLVWMQERSASERGPLASGVRPWLLAGLAALCVQIFLGTNVRAVLDRLASAAVDRSAWVAQAGLDFVIHRSFSWILILAQVGIYLKLRKTAVEKSSNLVSILLILCSLLTGTAMAYFGVPALMQPIHLLVAIIAVGWWYRLYLQTGQQSANPSAS